MMDSQEMGEDFISEARSYLANDFMPKIRSCLEVLENLPAHKLLEGLVNSCYAPSDCHCHSSPASRLIQFPFSQSEIGSQHSAIGLSFLEFCGQI